MKTLYILGNGFDRHFNLKTSVDDYINCLKQLNSNILNMNGFELFNNYGVNWGDYEQSLSRIDLLDIENNFISYPDYLSDHERDREDCIWNMNAVLDEFITIKNQALCNMIKNANEDIEKIFINRVKFNQLCDADAIISFNYTSTLEKLFILKEDVKVLHIHGYYENDSNNLIFGYKKPTIDYKKRFANNIDDYDYYVETQKENIYQFYLNLQKKIQIDKLLEFLSNINDIDKIIVLGHSMSEVDVDYMELIHDTYKDAKWYISYYNEKDKVIKNTLKYSFKEIIGLFKWNNENN